LNSLFEKEVLLLRVIESIEGLEEDSSDVTIKFTDGTYITQYHEQDCCESVYITQVDGNASKHIGATMISLEEKVLDSEDMSSDDLPDYYESLTATFYTMKTSKGYLDWRFFGESNGYYSESVNCKFITDIKASTEK
jgi:hypothetical protein